MAAKLKVYRAEIGGAHEWIVAARNQKDAASIWGVDLDVFKDGRGGPTTKPALVEPAMENPGTPLRRVLGRKGAFKAIPRTDVETWKLAAKALGLKGKAPSAPKVIPKAIAAKPKPAPNPKRAVKPKGPSTTGLAALARAETALATHVAASERAERDQDKARMALKAQQAAERKALAVRRAALETAVAEARRKTTG